jgi:hypothetical protein
MGDSIDDCRTEYLVEAEAVEALTEKMLGATESLLAAVEAKDTHDSLIMLSSGAGNSWGVPVTTSLATP